MARRRAEEQDVALAQQSQMIVQLQGTQEKQEAELLSASSEVVRAEAALAAALATANTSTSQKEKDLLLVAKQQAKQIEGKDTRISQLQRDLAAKIAESDSLENALTELVMHRGSAPGSTPVKLDLSPEPEPPAAAAADRTSTIRMPDGVRTTISLMQGPKGFGLTLSDSLHVEQLTPGGTAEKAGVLISAKVVEVAGQYVNTKRELAQVATAQDGATLVEFVFLEATPADNGRKLSEIKELHSMAMAEKAEEHKAELAQHQKQLMAVQLAHKALEEEMLSSTEDLQGVKDRAESGQAGVAEALRKAQAAHADAVEEAALWKDQHAELVSEKSDMEASHFEEIMSL